MSSNFTPQHSAASSHVPQETSQYLQERLQERRARNTRPHRFRQSDFGPRRGQDDDIFLTVAEEGESRPARFDHSPYLSGGKKTLDLGDSTRRRALGVRDVDEQMDRLTKENFALKLELDHRRDHTSKLQMRIEEMKEQVERAEKIEEEHTELLQINAQLVEELEKRDKAIEEAMDIICELEEKVADMEERNSTTRPSTANADSGYAGTETQEQAPVATPSSADSSAVKPERVNRAPPPAASAASNKLFNAVNGEPSTKARREPSILAKNQASHHALRSVYLANARDLNSVKSFTSLVSKRESQDMADDVLNSPRLSVLSESSLQSMYNPKISPERFAWESPDVDGSVKGGPLHLRQDSINRVNRWIDEGETIEETPSRSSRPSISASDATARGLSPTPKPRPSEDSPFQSLNDALSSAAADQSEPDMRNQVSYIQAQPAQPENQRVKRQPSGNGAQRFGEPLLPPTPGSATTSMLRTSFSSIIDEKSRNDAAPTPPIHGHAFPTKSPVSPKQMRSSIELSSAYMSNLKYRDEYYASYGQNAVLGDGYDEKRGEISNANPMGINSTPNRFLRRSKTPSVSRTFDDGEVPTPQTIRQVPRRRQSSSEAFVSPNKPSFGRADTSPNINGSLGRIVSNGSKPGSDHFPSPRSSNSGLSLNRTLPLPDLRSSQGHGSMSPDTLSSSRSMRTRTSASPARTLSQRTQMLFRRLSNSHNTDIRQFEPRSPREKSPLPTLTSTPSSQYHQPPKELRRPNTAESPKPSGLSQMAHIPRPPSTTGNGHAAGPGHGHHTRLSLSSRTRMDGPLPVPPGRPLSVALTERERESVVSSLEKERKLHHPFRRSNSVQKAAATVDLSTAVPVTQSSGLVGSVEVDEASTAARGGAGRRRGSFREAVAATARRPFR